MDGSTISCSSQPIDLSFRRSDMENILNDGKADENLERELNHLKFHFELDFDSVVKNKVTGIEVEHKIRFLRYKPRNSKTNERYFPAKICIKMRSKCDFTISSILMGESTLDRSVTVTTTNCRKSGFKFQLGTGGAKGTLAHKRGNSTAHTWTKTRWQRKRDIEDSKVGCQAWILEDYSGVSALDYMSRKGEYKAFTDLAWDGPFSESGGINFEGEGGCGGPMTWRFKRTNRNIEGKSLKWSVEVEIWLAYYGTKYKEIRYKKFRDLSLVQRVRGTTPHPNEQQALLVGLFVILFLIYFCWSG